MMQSTSYSTPLATTPAWLGDALDALAVGVDEVGAGLVVGLQVLVVEAGPLAELAVPGLQVLGRVGSSTICVDPPADLLHLLEVGVLEGAIILSGVQSSGGSAMILLADRAGRGPSSRP